MKRRINKPQSILALATLLAWAALCLTACINQGFDPDDNSPHAHLTLLQLGNVTIADAQTAPAGTTRAATTEDATGFTGIRKTTFVAGDKLTLRFFVGSASGQHYAEKEASYDGTAWTLGERIFTAAGTTIRATYSPAAPATGHTYKDDLTSEDIELPVDGSATTIPMKHLHAMIEVTPPAGKTVSNVVVKATPTGTGTAESLATAQEVTTVSGQDAPIYRTIAKQGTVTAITLTIDGNAYTATLATALTVEGNKRYPIALSMKETELVATVGTASLGWGAGTDMDMDTNGDAANTYTRTIGTAEDLAQFAHEVNYNLNNAYKAVVMQTADIDLSKLTAADAPANSGKGYTYTATAEQWVPIGIANTSPFAGKYNGNGFTISNLKMTQPHTDNCIGLFGYAVSASFTGIHIRDCSLADDNVTANAGALIAKTEEVTVALCSATGTMTMTNASSIAGGLIGKMMATRSINSHITRCNVDANVTGPNNQKISGFAGLSDYTNFVSCTYNGTLTFSNTPNNDACTLFCNGNEYTKYFFCTTKGRMVNKGNLASIFGKAHTLISCMGTEANYHSFYANTPTTVESNLTLFEFAIGIQDGVTVDQTGEILKTLLAGDHISPANNLIKTLHWSQADGYTLTEVERQWKADGAWKSNSLGRLDLEYEGEATVP